MKKIRRKHWLRLSAIFVLVILLSLMIYFIPQRTMQKTNAAGVFQPSPPYYVTFFYPWYQNPNTDESWSQWPDLGHKPPQNWFSQYLPDPNPAVFDPANELYSSRNDQIIYWQLGKLAQAKQEVAISSWWGQNHKTDIAFRKIITDIMNRPDNPYPNLRWAIYYEKEGFGNPPLSELISDILYIKSNYANQKGYFYINNKPVIFVYNAKHIGSNSLEDLARWKLVREQTGIYVVMKVDPLNDGANITDMDSWHEYAPASRSNAKLPFYSFVSPGFWLDGQAEKLPRDAGAFENSVKQMVSANATWKLTETWNEWGEGSGVEPAEQVNQLTTGIATLKLGGYPFKNLYVDILNRNLPPLENGTGTSSPLSPVPSPQALTSLQITLKLHGLGKGGDSSNPTGLGNYLLKRPQRLITIELFNSQNQLVLTKNTTVSFDPISGKFIGSIDLSSSVISGSYIVKIKSDQYLRTGSNQIVQIKSGQQNTLNERTLITGDINNDNQLSILDYNILMNCFSDLSAPRMCLSANKLLSDLTDDGQVNQFDYNLLLREFSNKSGI